MADDERALIGRAAGHDAEAFARLYDRHVDKIYKYIYYRVRSVAETEDLTAQVFLKAWEGIGGYKQTGRPFAAWLYRIAHNLVIDHFRTRRETAPLEETQLAGEGRSALEDLAQHRLTAETLRRAIARLTDEQQQVIILRFLEGYSSEEVARLMSKAPGAVRALQHRALGALRRIFQKGLEKL